ncbi:MAG: isoaspartyl peptidase/L-asparaginase [Xanthomonadales bacterium]|nr:isoaspartyl peptidase/L-asparaginase [Xanthomonadales bacterium]
MTDSIIRFALHGGAGVLDPNSFPEARRIEVARTLRSIAAHACAALRGGASAVAVVGQAVAELEDAEFFNAGYGAVLNADGEVELDAAIMDGRDRSAGAVCATRGLHNPVRVADAVRRDGRHVLLAGDGAQRFAREQGLEVCDPAALIVPIRLAQLREAQRENRISLDHDERYDLIARKSGTVGAVARDRQGHLAAATSTGGMTNKHVGRVGDAPLIGAGTFADDDSCAVSATGHGEAFIRAVLAHDLHARLIYRGQPLSEAAAAVLDKVVHFGGSGGLIAIDREGRTVLPFNSPGMYRAWLEGDAIRVGIYRDAEPA